MEIRLRIGPVPLRDDDVALDALRPRRRRRQLAAGDAVGPVGEHRQRAVLAHRVEAAGHLRAGLSRLNAPLPGLRRTVERAERLRDLARPFGAELVTRGAAARLQAANPVGLALDVRRDAVAARRVAGELALLRHADQREPVAGGIVLGRRARIRRRDRRQVQGLARRRLHLRRVDQAVAADPDVVGGFRQIGEQVAAAIVGDDDLDELRRQIGRFRDHPDAGLGSLRGRDDAADVVGVDANRIAGSLAGAHQSRRPCQQQREANYRRARVQRARRLHVSPPDGLALCGETICPYSRDRLTRSLLRQVLVDPLPIGPRTRNRIIASLLPCDTTRRS